MTRSRPDLVVVGDCCPDVILTGSRVRPVFGQAETLVDAGRLTIGGSASIMACGAARLGLTTALVSVVGDDELGAYVRAAIAARGVDISAVRADRQVPTGLTVVLSEPDDRAMLTAAGTIELLTASAVPDDLLHQAGHVHVSSYYLLARLRPDLRALLLAARAAGATTSLDTNWDPAGRWDGVADLLDVVDVLLPNASELTHLTGNADAESAARQLAAAGPLVVVKRGPDPALAVAGHTAWAAAPPPVRAIDPTGAGDSFNAGFLRAWIRGAPVPEALRLACACGALSTRAIGGTTAQPDQETATAAAAGLTAAQLTTPSTGRSIR